MALPTIPAYDLPQPGDWPASRAAWTPQTDRMALLVHDMQSYFCAPFVQDAAPLKPLIANIDRLARAARAAGIPVFYTAQQGNQLPSDRGLQRDLWGPGMSRDPAHEAILPDLAPQPDDIVLVKHRYSAFQRSNLQHLMRARGRDQLMITGIYSHIGCLATASEAFQLDIEPFTIADAQADFDRARHDMAMSWVASVCGVVLATQDMLNQLDPAPAHRS
ncbi:isochorismatase family protein [Pseudooceanicola sediminis]|uniref:Isochorismatase family protein n=1 Tax=Pseudooceanicola sediminis TaxID=2211117 RepID=A0A399IYL7_9RHOB|nr:isochorismatase family protein [Pseudooceanicola sediminis]KAA2316044.1 isochorismatase family protein [Puniceibacterium sp. HSS470]RII38155.1 isochorismatase family protein [Pseudooceanicola sediminis]|tara:strand:+ start:27520 stop:28176 length:657 start_codon:yes stop_codon:yes gene_type:complete